MGEKLTPSGLIEQQDDYRIALEVKRLTDAGELSQRQANSILAPTVYRLDEKPVYEINKRPMGSANE